MIRKGELTMSAVAVEFVVTLLKAACFGAVAFAGIMCGKKYRDHKDKKS